MAATIFGSIVAAVIVSTVIIMSLMRGEIANALSSNVQTNNQGAQTAAVTPVTCATTPADTEDTAPVIEAGDAPAPQPAATMPSVVKHSFNTVNNTTNNVTNTEIHNKTVKNTTIKDSFNDNSTHIKDSFNPVIVKDNNVEINSNNKSIDITKVDIDKTYNWNSHNTTVASNNVTVNSNNTENHVLSDNNVVVAPFVAAPVVQVQ